MRLRLSLIVICFLFPLLSINPQSRGNDSIPTLKEAIREKKPRGIINAIGHLLNDIDTTYISPNKFNFAFMLENSEWYEYYRIKNGRDQERNQSITFSPDMSYKLGAYFGWRWIFLGWSIDLKDLFGKNKPSHKKTEFALSLYSSVAGIDIYSKKSNGGFRLKDVTGFFPNEKEPIYPQQFDGFSVNIKGLNIYWIFNHRKFSYPAAFSQSTNQRRNAGSFIAGFSVSTHEIEFDYDRLPASILNNMDNTLKVREIKYHDFNLNAGYAYNWVFARNCLATISLTPAIAYKKSKINGEEVHYDPLKNINFDIITRAGITYNNSKYFIGASLVMHTYDYKSDQLYLNNSFGTLRIYAGFNFFKKKEYRNK